MSYPDWIIEQALNHLEKVFKEDENAEEKIKAVIEDMAKFLEVVDRQYLLQDLNDVLDQNAPSQPDGTIQ